MEKLRLILICVLLGAIAASCDKGTDENNVQEESSTSTGSGNDGSTGNSNGTGTNTGNTGGSTGTTSVTYSFSTWHWGSESNALGINYVVNDNSLAAQVLESYKINNIKTVYGGYSRIPAHPTQKYKLASWNKRLRENGILSEYLTGDASWIYPENRQVMLDYIKKYYIDYNTEFSGSEGFSGLHVDIEPHQLSEWSLASTGRKRELLLMLKDTYRDIHNLLAEYNMNNGELIADIPVWFDNMSAIGWTSAADRDAWFAAASQFLTGFSLMAYEVNSLETILSRTEWERTNFEGRVEIGLDAGEIGSVWSGKNIFVNSLKLLYTRSNKSVAIHNYAVYMVK